MILRKSCASVRRRGSDMDYKCNETEICHNGRLGCWVPVESGKDRAVRWARCILEGVCFAFLMFGLIMLCAVA